MLVCLTKKNKPSTKYNPMPHRVPRRKGSRVTAFANGHYITRNISFFEKLSNAIRKDLHARQEGRESKYNYFEKEIVELDEESNEQR